MHKPIIVWILDPKKYARHIQEFARKIGFEGCFHGDPVNTHIWIFCWNVVQLRDFTVTEQSIYFHINRSGEGDIKFTTVYANAQERNDFLCGRIYRLRATRMMLGL